MFEGILLWPIVHPSPAPVIRAGSGNIKPSGLARRGASVRTEYSDERRCRISPSKTLVERFPDFRVAFVLAEPLDDRACARPELASDIAAAEADCRRRWGGMELSAIPEVAAWRAAYKGFGIKRTSYRSSVERLIKRVLAGQPLPEINALVDLYNMVSLETGLCLGCDDLDKTSGDLVFRFSRPGDSFRRHGRGGRARTRTIRRRRARSSTPTTATCSAGAGTGARTPAPPRARRPGAPF